MKVSQPHKLLSLLLHLGTSSLFGDPIGLCEDSTEVINYKEGFWGGLTMKMIVTTTRVIPRATSFYKLKKKNERTNSVYAEFSKLKSSYMLTILVLV